MNETLILGLVAMCVVIAGFLLRVNAVFLFLGVVTGVLVQTYLGESADLALAAVAKNAPTGLIADIGSMVLFLLLSVFLFRRTMPHRSFLMQIIPMVCVGVSFALLLLKVMPIGFQQAVGVDSIGSVLVRSSDLMIAITAISCLLLAWRIYRHHSTKHA